jgi:hypothetical protein
MTDYCFNGLSGATHWLCISLEQLTQIGLLAATPVVVSSMLCAAFMPVISAWPLPTPSTSPARSIFLWAGRNRLSLELTILTPSAVSVTAMVVALCVRSGEGHDFSSDPFSVHEGLPFSADGDGGQGGRAGGDPTACTRGLSSPSRGPNGRRGKKGGWGEAGR